MSAVRQPGKLGLPRRGQAGEFLDNIAAARMYLGDTFEHLDELAGSVFLVGEELGKKL